MSHHIFTGTGFFLYEILLKRILLWVFFFFSWKILIPTSLHRGSIKRETSDVCRYSYTTWKYLVSCLYNKNEFLPACSVFMSGQSTPKCLVFIAHCAIRKKKVSTIFLNLEPPLVTLSTGTPEIPRTFSEHVSFSFYAANLPGFFFFHKF